MDNGLAGQGDQALEPGARVEVSGGVRNEAQAAAQRLAAELMGRRKILTGDELAQLQERRVRLEKEFPRLRAYFFTIDGVLNGETVRGALFAGQCILVFAPNFAQANFLAKAGLADTVELLLEDYDRRESENAIAIREGSAVDIGGRRVQPLKNGEPLVRRNPKLHAMLEHVLGGKPWRF